MRDASMADVIKNFNYSKTRGRGRGILGLTNFDPSRRPGERSTSTVSGQQSVPSLSNSASKEAPRAGVTVENEQTESVGVYV